MTRRFPSGGAIFLLGVGLFVPAGIAAVSDKNDSSNVPDFILVLAIVVMLIGLFRTGMDAGGCER
jgi:hypothetical protein